MNKKHESKIEAKRRAGMNKDRALGLKMGTWDNDKSPEMKTLKKIIKTFPWIINVADRSFDREYADAAHIEAAVEILGADGLTEILKGLKGIEDD